MKKRIIWIDNLRGIAAILVLVGHLVPNESIIKNIIYNIHIPAFFFITGYLYHNKKSFFEYVKKLSKTILLPYFICSILSLFVYFILNEVSLNFSFIIENLFYLNGYIIWNSSLWFLPVFFFANIIFYFIDKYNVNIKYVLLFSLLLLLFFTTTKIILPFGLHIVPSALFWFSIGKLSKIYNNKFNNIINYFNKRVYLILLFFIILNTITIFSGRINISINEYPLLILNLFISLFSLFTLMFFVKKLNYNNILTSFL